MKHFIRAQQAVPRNFLLHLLLGYTHTEGAKAIQQVCIEPSSNMCWEMDTGRAL
jgi:hypothetical protein